MSPDIDESDWKQFQKLHSVALERYCQRVLDELGAISSDISKSAHERYLEIHRLNTSRHKELAQTFDDLRRSTAFLHIFAIQSLGLLAEQEFKLFTQETQDRINVLLEDRRA